MRQLIVNRHGYLKEIPDAWRIPGRSRAATDIEREYFERTGDPVASNAGVKAKPKPSGKSK